MQTLEGKRTPVNDVFCELRSKVTRAQFPKILKRFFDYLHLPGSTVDEQGQVFLHNARRDSDYANDKIREYILTNRDRVDRGEITPGSLKGLFTPIKTFCDGYDDVTAKVNWKRIRKSMPPIQHYSDDRAPTIEEIRKLVEFPDRRIKALVYVMCSSGIRIGAWEYMKWKHLKPVTNDKDEVIAAHLQVYAKDWGNYKTYMTPEAYNEVKKWMDFRGSYGEQITPDSWVMRNEFKTADIK
jgi:hypothetical protein